MKLKYRADIDGLRAIAVLSVLFYHTGIPLFSGGFAGVDVFFVISGYLITTIIVKEIDAKEFSLAKFYAGRIRRIFPALFIVMIFTLITSLILFDAENFKQFGQSLFAASFFFANILFWNQSGYFDAPSSLKPLLHVWSLSVEEQYYIVFPILVVFLSSHFRRKPPFFLISFTIISFLLSIYAMSYGKTSSAFYLPHLRIWELLCGSILAFKLFPKPKNHSLAKILGLSGLALISFAVFYYTTDTNFPGWSALPPVLGSILIIHSDAQHTSWANKILSSRHLVFIGKISYSLYLWHWPIIVFGKYFIIRLPTAYEMAGLIFLSLIASVISWKFIETPFRTRSIENTTQLFSYASISMLVMSLIGLSIYFNNGFPQRIKEIPVNTTTQSEFNWRKCDYTENIHGSTPPICLVGKNTSNPVFLLWGDSHAFSLAPGIHISALKNNVQGSFTFMSSCPPALDIRFRKGGGDCMQFNDAVFNYIKNNPSIKTIILTSEWAAYTDESTSENSNENEIFLIKRDFKYQDPPLTNTEVFKFGIDQTIDKILKLGKDIVIVSQIPNIGYDVPSAYSIAKRTGRDINEIIAPTRAEYLQKNLNTIHMLQGIHEKYKIQIIHPEDLLCAKTCSVVAQNQAIYGDSHHLSTFGSQYISAIFDSLFTSLTGIK